MFTIQKLGHYFENNDGTDCTLIILDMDGKEISKINAHSVILRCQVKMYDDVFNLQKSKILGDHLGEVFIKTTCEQAVHDLVRNMYNLKPKGDFKNYNHWYECIRISDFWEIPIPSWCDELPADIRVEDVADIITYLIKSIPESCHEIRNKIHKMIFTLKENVKFDDVNIQNSIQNILPKIMYTRNGKTYTSRLDICGNISEPELFSKRELVATSPDRKHNVWRKNNYFSDDEFTFLLLPSISEVKSVKITNNREIVIVHKNTVSLNWKDGMKSYTFDKILAFPHILNENIFWCASKNGESYIYQFTSTTKKTIILKNRPVTDNITFFGDRWLSKGLYSSFKVYNHHKEDYEHMYIKQKSLDTINWNNAVIFNYIIDNKSTLILYESNNLYSICECEKFDVTEDYILIYNKKEIHLKKFGIEGVLIFPFEEFDMIKIFN